MSRLMITAFLACASLAGCGTKDGQPNLADDATIDANDDVQAKADADVTATDTADVADTPDIAAPEDVADVADIADTSDISDVGAVDCAKLVTDWAAFVAAHKTCAVTADCAIAGGAGSCDAAAAIGEPSGDAIAKSAFPDAQALLTAFYGAECKAYRDAHGVWDAAPAQNLRCENGQCKADWASCLVPPDVGQPDAAVGD